MTTLSIAIKRNLWDWLLTARQKLKAFSSEQRASFFVLSAGALLALGGGAYVLESFAKTQSLDTPDPIFGLSFRFAILGFGMMQLLVAVVCLFTNRRSFSLSLVLWLTAQFTIYRLGLWMMGWPHPYGLTSILTQGLSLSAVGADLLMGMAAVYLASGSLWSLLKLRRIQTENEFLKTSCPACGVHIRFAVQNLGRKVTCSQCKAPLTLRKPEETLKMYCYFCEGRIEFPAHAIGEKLECPHCKMGITLKEPA